VSTQAQTYQVLIWGPATALATSQAQGSSVSSVHESEPSSNALAPSTSSSRKPDDSIGQHLAKSDDSEQNPWTTEDDQVLADLARKKSSQYVMQRGLKRTGKEIAARMIFLNDLDSEFRGVFSVHVKYLKNYQKYTTLEDQTLTKLYN
jgi:hypothetical protein